MVELAIVFPLLALLLFGIISFGAVYNNYEALRQGTRDAARQVAVGQFGTNTSCGLTGLSVATTETRKVMCEAKDLVGLGNNLRVKVVMIDTVTAPPYGAVLVCTQYLQNSVTGLMNQFLGGKVLHTQVQMRTEKTLSPAPVSDAETPPSGGSWSWCTAI
jgi:hypothetical protein